jgi:hypothetical protein
MQFSVVLLFLPCQMKGHERHVNKATRMAVHFADLDIAGATKGRAAAIWEDMMKVLRGNRPWGTSADMVVSDKVYLEPQTFSTARSLSADHADHTGTRRDPSAP